MSDIANLIAALDRTTASNIALTAAVEAGNEGRAAVLEVAKGASTKPAAAKKPAEKSDDKPAATEKADAPKENPVSAAIVSYLDGIEGAERDARKAKVQEIFGKVGATKLSEIPADKTDVVVRTMEKLIAAGNLIQTETADPEDDDLLN